jgi:hypothetical protein
LAKGAAARGKKIAFGSELHKQLVWDHNSEIIFRSNPNIAFPGQEHDYNVEWIAYFKGYRGYNTQGNGHWIWNMRWRCTPGEIYLTGEEKRLGDRRGKDFIVIEPNIESWKSAAQNKDWGRAKYAAVVELLLQKGHEIVQFDYPKAGPIVRGVRGIRTSNFREALAILRNARLYLGAEGGLHHGAAALGIPAVVLFGGFIPPSVTGYDMHINLAGSERFCGSFTRCQHCSDAMASISVEKVYNSVLGFLGDGQ